MGSVVTPPRSRSIPELLYLASGPSEPIDWQAERALARSYDIEGLLAGDLVLARLSLSVQSNPAFETLTMRFRLGGLGGSALLTHAMSSISARDYLMRMTVRSVGAPGSAPVLSGQELFSMGGMLVTSSVVSFDTTVPQSLVVTGSWSTVLSSPSARVESFEVWRHRPAHHS